MLIPVNVVHVCVFFLTVILRILPYKFYVLGQIGLSKQCRPEEQGLRCLPFHQHLLDALAMLHQTFLFLGQLWHLFEVSQILEFLR